jgi:hypothetical protein
VNLSRQKIGSIDNVGQHSPPLFFKDHRFVTLFRRRNLIRMVDSDPRIQNMDSFIYVLWVADGRMNHSKSDHDFNPELRGGHVRIDARASLRAERGTE